MVSGKWVKYNKNIFIYVFISFLSEARAQVRPVDGFLRAIAQKNVKSRDDVPFWGYKK